MSKQKLPPLSCPECGSRNVEVRPSGHSLLERLGAMLKTAHGPGGRKILVCKDCGHKAMLQVL